MTTDMGAAEKLLHEIMAQREARRLADEMINGRYRRLKKDDPVYAVVITVGDLLVCQHCGCAVFTTTAVHDAWHERIERT